MAGAASLMLSFMTGEHHHLNPSSTPFDLLLITLLIHDNCNAIIMEFLS